MAKESSYYADKWYPRVKAARAAAKAKVAAEPAAQEAAPAERTLQSRVDGVQARAEQSGIEGFSPVAAYLNEGPEALREWLGRQDAKDLRTILRRNAMDPAREAGRTKSVEKLVAMVMEMTELRAHAGDGFRNFHY